MHVLMTPSAVFFIFLLLTLLLITTSRQEERKQLDKDRDALIAFITNPDIKIRDDSKYNWHKSKNYTCDLNGVTCSAGNFSVLTLRLPGASVVGKIPPDTLGKITSLTVLSLHDNRLSGPLPDDFDKLSQLSYVHLHKNNLSGEFPSSVVAGWTLLKKLDLSNNNFSGRLPKNLPPSLQLENFNVANNNLSGPIPTSLADKLPKAAISGNIQLCGKPLPNPCNDAEYTPEPPSPSPSPSGDKKLTPGEIAAIAIGSALILLILLICLGKRWNRAVKEKKTTSGEGTGCGDKVEAGTSSSAFMEGKRNELVFLGEGVYSFDLEDLLRASAEVMGKGSVGKSYKTVLKEGITVVVKRLKNVDVGEKEFDGVMQGIGKMKNENVVPIRAYYYSKDEKFFVCDYFSAGSLSALLHGRRGSGHTPLGWDHRFRIALSAAKGVAYLHVPGEMVHGNIKSSNILLRQDSNKDASVSDFGLNTLFGGTSSPNTRVTGYHAPEVLVTRKVTFKSDVYSFGVLLLELLTGKAPNQASLGEEGIDLPRWVQLVVREEWTAREEWTTKVFDAELMRNQNVEEEMIQLLHIAMACVSTVPDQRPAMQEVVRMMEHMNRVETDDGMRQSSDDPSNGSDGHTPPTESRNSPNNVTP